MTAGRHGWQLAGTAAELYERLLVPAVTLPWARDLVARVGLAEGGRVLDLACGTGVVARLAATTVGTGGRVAALDVNREMLTVARSLPRPSGAAIEWYEGHAGALPFASGEFDAVVCQLGLQFFPDRPAAVREMRRVLALGGRAAASVFATIERNPAALALADAVDCELGAGASQAKRSEHALADVEELRELFDTAGFAGVRVETVTRTVRFASVEEWVRIQFAATPLAALVADRDAVQRERVLTVVSTAVAVALSAEPRGETFAFPQVVNVAVGHT